MTSTGELARRERYGEVSATTSNDSVGERLVERLSVESVIVAVDGSGRVLSCDGLRLAFRADPRESGGRASLGGPVVSRWPRHYSKPWSRGILVGNEESAERRCGELHFPRSPRNGKRPGKLSRTWLMSTSRKLSSPQTKQSRRSDERSARTGVRGWTATF